MWNAILAFNSDKPVSEYGFSTRLASENGWTFNFATGAILEYKKFMYLAATSGSMVSPSPIVDVARPPAPIEPQGDCINAWDFTMLDLLAHHGKAFYPTLLRDCLVKLIFKIQCGE